MCSKACWFWKERQLTQILEKSTSYSICAQFLKWSILQSQRHTHQLANRFQLQRIWFHNKKGSSGEWFMFTCYEHSRLRSEFSGRNVSLGCLEVSMCLIVLLAWKLLGCLDQQRIPDVWCFHGKYYFNSRRLTHLMGRLPTGPSCLPTLPHLLRFFCEIKRLDTWILPKTKQN